MEHLIDKYRHKLLADGTAVPDSVRFYVLDDRVIAGQRDAWEPVFTGVFAGLNVTSLLFARLALPFADFLIKRSAPDTNRIIPKDSETRTFQHDIPFLRREEWIEKEPDDVAGKIISALKERKAMIIEDLGVVASGGLTVEQAYIGYSTIFHTTFVKYLLDVLHKGFLVPGEREAFHDFEHHWLAAPDTRGLAFAHGLLTDPRSIMEEMWRVGRYTVEKGLVDSYFGNISYFDGSTLYISQTASSLDELEGHIDPVPLDGSSTAGLSASSELPAHRAIYQSSDYHALLHGHPRFSVILSMYCEEKGCDIEDCSRLCMRPRTTSGVPIVSGEPGAGGLGKTVPPKIRECGTCIVYGHGVFSAGREDFQEAFENMVATENQCREEYFSLLKKKGILT